ncbi:MAG: hypothetical protein PHT33_08700 [bacterium]|nr:hypothetical protein [bacterium]
MVYGIERFKEYFSDYTEQYILIGGTACAILLDEIGVPKRSRNIKMMSFGCYVLLRNVSPGIRIPVEKAVREDVKSFLVKVIEDPPDLKNLGFGKMTLEAICLQIRELYGIVEGKG